TATISGTDGSFTQSGTDADTAQSLGLAVTASFDTDSSYNASTSSVQNYDVQKHATSLSAPSIPASVKWSKTFNASAVLTDSDDGGSIISGKTVSFGGSAAVSGQSATTDGTGSSSVTLTAINLPTASQTVTAD